MLSVVWLVDGMRDGEGVSLRVIRDALRHAVSRYEFVLVTRDVATVARHFAEADPHIRIVAPRRRGDAAALTAACAVLSGDYVLPVIGDAIPDWDALRALMPFLERTDVVAARGGETATRNVLVRAMSGFLFGVTLREPLNPTKLYRAELVQGLSFVSSGPALQLELAAKARAQGAIVTEVVMAAGGTPIAPMSVRMSQIVRLWLYLRGFRPRWTVRARHWPHTPSEYVCGGIALAAILWIARGWIVREQK